MERAGYRSNVFLNTKHSGLMFSWEHFLLNVAGSVLLQVQKKDVQTGSGAHPTSYRMGTGGGGSVILPE